MYQHIGNMPKACPYVMMPSPIVADIIHRICEGKREWGNFLFALLDNLISEDWFFAEGERFLSFCDATDLAGEVGVGDVVWLIQATA